MQLAPDVRFMRDPTRGGASAVLNEVVENQALDILIRESEIPIAAATGAAAEMLGLDILHIASEGRLILFCDPDAAESILAAWRRLPEGRGAVRIGTVTDGDGRVVMETVTGGRRLVDVPRGELLPRIC